MEEKKQKPKKQNNPRVPQLGIESAGVVEASYDLSNPPLLVEGIKINLGSGRDNKRGFINVDKYDKNAEIMADIINLPFNDCSIAQIYSSETLEHLSKEEINIALKELYRVLKFGGNLILTVPDMVSACERFLKEPEDDWQLARIYGNQTHEGQFHKWGFTPKRLFLLLGSAGFIKIGVAYFTQENGVRNIFVEAIK